MFSFSTSISLGDVVLLMSVLGSIAYNYFAVVRRVDILEVHHQNLENDFEDLRRGRGLILEHWPPMVRKCFGYNRIRADG